MIKEYFKKRRRKKSVKKLFETLITSGTWIDIGSGSLWRELDLTLNGKRFYIVSHSCKTGTHRSIQYDNLEVWKEIFNYDGGSHSERTCDGEWIDLLFDYAESKGVYF